MYRAGLRFSLHGKLLLPIVCILLTATCHNNSAKQFPALLPAPAKTAGSPSLPSVAPPTLSDRESIPPNPNGAAANKAAGLSATAPLKSQLATATPPNSQAQPNPPTGNLDVKVRIKSAAGGWTTVPLATAIRDSLDAFTESGFIFECPARMRVGSTYKVQLATRKNLDDLLRQHLQDRGIPAEYLKGIMTLVVAEAPAPADNSFAIRPEESAARQFSDTWVWQVEPREPGNHKLELRITLKARVPSGGEVGTAAAMISRTVAVDADPFYRYGNFFDRHWIEVAASVAALMGAGLWMLWRTRRAALSHH